MALLIGAFWRNDLSTTIGKRAAFLLATAVSSLLLAGCASVFDQAKLARSSGEMASGYGYVPLDGLAVDQTRGADSCKATKAAWLPLLQALPDLSVRFTVADIQPSGDLSFGPAKITASGQTYRAVLDYVNIDAIPEDFYLRKYIRPKLGEPYSAPLKAALNDGDTVVGYDAILVEKSEKAPPGPVAEVNDYAKKGYDPVTFPIYIGIGMRLTADVRALKSGINLSSLGAIGAEAEVSALSGTLTVQTLGINGKSIATALPLPNKLDQTTIENGLLALGSGRASIYSSGNASSDVTSTPRVVGLYSPIGTDPLLINAIYSELSRKRPKWDHPCGPSTTQMAESASDTSSAGTSGNATVKKRVSAKKVATAKR